MQKNRESYTDMTQRKGMGTQGTQNHPAGQDHSEQDVSTQELVAPKWRGPFEGYR